MMASRVGSHPWRLLLIGFFLATAAVGAMLTASRAAAVFTEIAETGRPGYLVLGMKTSTPLWAELAPGDSMRWLVKASLHDVEASGLEVELAVADAQPVAGDFMAEIRSCSEDFDLETNPPSCTGTEWEVLTPTSFSTFMPGTERIVLSTLRQGAPNHLLVTITRPMAQPAVDDPRGTLVRFGLGVHATGDSPSSSDSPGRRPEHLAATGADVLPLALLSVGLIGLSSVIAFSRRSGVRS